MTELPHLDESGAARMVDVSGKQPTRRVAVAEAVVELSSATADLLFSGGLEKGDALAVARIAGIMGAKRASDLIPLCHPLAITSVDLDISRVGEGAHVEATVTTTGPTGVEIEALTAASMAALALYDMVKSQERGATISRVQLLEKSGGRSGTWTR